MFRQPGFTAEGGEDGPLLVRGEAGAHPLVQLAGGAGRGELLPVAKSHARKFTVWRAGCNSAHLGLALSGTQRPMTGCV